MRKLIITVTKTMDVITKTIGLLKREIIYWKQRGFLEVSFSVAVVGYCDIKPKHNFKCVN